MIANAWQAIQADTVIRDAFDVEWEGGAIFYHKGMRISGKLAAFVRRKYPMSLAARLVSPF